MNLEIDNQLFIVCGATSGFGKAIAGALLHEGARIIAIARNASMLETLYGNNKNATVLAADITHPASIATLAKLTDTANVHGIVINAGGPPAKTVLETTLADWDEAYSKILRWKVDLIQAFVPKMAAQAYGRLLFIESASVKQPIENLVLSNAFRLAVTGMAKTLSQEIAHTGITVNVLAPGSHNTPAIDRLYHKKSEQTGQPFDTVKQNAIAQIPVKTLGEADDFASLALWLLSPKSRYVTGQVYAVDGGTVKGTL
jgi:3-oxoacyl-[acyl-carrier protein] reductase